MNEAQQRGSGYSLPLGNGIYVLTENDSFGRDIRSELSAQECDVCIFEHFDDAAMTAQGRSPAVIIIDAALDGQADFGFTALHAPEAFSRAVLIMVLYESGEHTPFADGLKGRSTFAGPVYLLPNQRRDLVQAVLGVSRRGRFTPVPQSDPPRLMAASLPIAKRAVVADEDPVVRQILSYELSRAGWEVFLATDGDQVLALLGQFALQVAVIDADLPIRNAYEILRVIARQPGLSATLYVVLSGQDPDISAPRAFSLGAGEFIAKPLNPEVLLWRLSHHFQLRQHV